jgi:hypothetical protein
MAFKKYPPETNIILVQFSNDPDVQHFVRRKMMEMGYETVEDTKDLFVKDNEDSNFIRSLFPETGSGRHPGLFDKAAEALKQFLQNQFGTDVENTVRQSMLYLDLKHLLEENGREKFIKTVREVLDEDAVSDHDSQAGANATLAEWGVKFRNKSLSQVKFGQAEEIVHKSEKYKPDLLVIHVIMRSTAKPPTTQDKISLEEFVGFIAGLLVPELMPPKFVKFSTDPELDTQIHRDLATFPTMGTIAGKTEKEMKRILTPDVEEKGLTAVKRTLKLGFGLELKPPAPGPSMEM